MFFKIKKKKEKRENQSQTENNTAKIDKLKDEYNTERFGRSTLGQTRTKVEVVGVHEVFDGGHGH